MREAGLQGRCLRFGEEGETKEWRYGGRRTSEMMHCCRNGTGPGKTTMRGLVGKRE